MTRCPICGNKENYAQIIENAIVVIPFEESVDLVKEGDVDVYLHEEGDKIETLYCNAGDPYFQCTDCGWVLPSKTLEEAIRWLKQ